MNPLASSPLEITSSPEDTQAHGEPDAVSTQDIKVSDERIDELAWLVEKLSNSLSETRSRQTRLAMVLEQSLTGIGRALAESEARVHEILDERFSSFEQAQNIESEAGDHDFKALSAQFEAEAERNDQALAEFRASLETMERTLALSEARAEERTDERLSRFEQAQADRPEASDERLGALGARLDVESERNEYALSDLRAAMEAMERSVAASEARVEEILESRLDGFEQEREGDAKAGEARFEALGAKIDTVSERNEQGLSSLRAMLEAMERPVASAEARAEESWGERINRLEEQFGKESEDCEERLGALAAKFDAETKRNEAALFDLRASLEIMERNFSEIESQVADAMKSGLSLHDHAKKQEAEALRGTVEGLMKQGSIREAIEMHWNKKKP